MAVVVVLDDLQWADPDSVGLLRVVAADARRLRVLVNGTIRTQQATGATSEALVRAADEAEAARLATTPNSFDQRVRRPIARSAHYGAGVAEVLRVVQLNTGSLLEPGWAERRHEIIAWLEKTGPDIVCLQEMWEDDNTPNAAAWIAEQMADHGWHSHFDGRPFSEALWADARLRFGSAVLSRWPIDAAAYHQLPVADDPDDPFVNGVPWELLHVKTAGIDVFSCHLAAAPTHGRHRRLQVLAIDEVITRSQPRADLVPGSGPIDGMPPILCGDFNAEPDSDEIRFLSSLAVLEGRTTFYQDAWRVAGDGPGYTQDWRTNPIARSMNIHRKRIDYVFVGDPFQRRGGAGRVLRADLAFHEPLTGTLASDHTGLVVDIVWPQRPG